MSANPLADPLAARLTDDVLVPAIDRPCIDPQCPGCLKDAAATANRRRAEILAAITPTLVEWQEAKNTLKHELDGANDAIMAIRQKCDEQAGAAAAFVDDAVQLVINRMAAAEAERDTLKAAVLDFLTHHDAWLDAERIAPHRSWPEARGRAERAKLALRALVETP